jgi:hypothetical protein
VPIVVPLTLVLFFIFPRKLSGYFFGISENIADALTFLILIDDIYEVLSRSDVRQFYYDLNPNLRTISHPDILSNLDFLPSPVENGFKLSSNYVIVSLKKHVTLTFDHLIKTLDDGCVTGVMMRPIVSEKLYSAYAHTSIGSDKILEINYLHRVFGHCGLETLKSTVQMYGLKHSGEFETCEECAVAKAGQVQAMSRVSNFTLI